MKATPIPLVLTIATASLLAGSMAAGGDCRLAVSSTPTYRTAATNFSAGEVVDLHVWATYPRVTQAQTMALRFTTPNGHLYEEQAVPLEPDFSRQRSKAVDGHPFPVPVAKPAAKPEADPALREVGAKGKRPQPAFVKVGVLRVAGTMITTSSLYGEWRVEFTSPDEKLACKLTFELSR